MPKGARLREQRTSMNAMKERREEGEEKKEERKEGGQARHAERGTLKVQSTDQEARKRA